MYQIAFFERAFINETLKISGEKKIHYIANEYDDTKAFHEDREKDQTRPK